MLYYRLSWGLLYAVLVTFMSILMSIIATRTALFPNSDFFVIFILIFLYGISSVSRTGVTAAKVSWTSIIYKWFPWEQQSGWAGNVSLAFFPSIFSLFFHRSFSPSCWHRYSRNPSLPARWAPCWRWCLAACLSSRCWWRTSRSHWSGFCVCSPRAPSPLELLR